MHCLTFKIGVNWFLICFKLNVNRRERYHNTTLEIQFSETI